MPMDVVGALRVLEVARATMLTICRELRPTSRVYIAVSGVITAIDGLAEALTGNREFFWIGGSVAPGRGDAVRARENDVGTQG